LALALDPDFAQAADPVAAGVVERAAAEFATSPDSALVCPRAAKESCAFGFSIFAELGAVDALTQPLLALGAPPPSGGVKQEVA
jgi:hypothetical protein